MATAKKTTPKLAADPADQGKTSSSTPRAAKTPSTSPESAPPTAPKPRRSRKSEPANATLASPSTSEASGSEAASFASKPAESSKVVASTTSPSSFDAPTVDVDAPSLDASLESRLREHAYLLAESNHFAGDPSFYWRVAERELARSGLFDAPSTERPRGAHAETR